MKYRKTNYGELVQRWEKCCSRCEYKVNDGDEETADRIAVPKPIRAHHCSICRECVMTMDHHCPWINNCVGLNNHRWFLMMLVYLFLGGSFVSLHIYTLSNYKGFYYHSNLMPMVQGASIAIMIGMFFFNIWQWFLALKGVPQIELMQSKMNKMKQQFAEADETFTYGCSNVVDNLHIIFGTRNFFKMMIGVDRARTMPLTGLEWTGLRMKSMAMSSGFSNPVPAP